MWTVVLTDLDSKIYVNDSQMFVFFLVLSSTFYFYNPLFTLQLSRFLTWGQFEVKFSGYTIHISF